MQHEDNMRPNLWTELSQELLSKGVLWWQETWTTDPAERTMSSRTSHSEEWARRWRRCKRCSRQLWIQPRPGTIDVLWKHGILWHPWEKKIEEPFGEIVISICRATVFWCSLGEDQAIQSKQGCGECDTGACCKHLITFCSGNMECHALRGLC